ncbi:MAG TPA: TonB-dependent receptor [Pyrinomonadaceae bacterium]|nr:TonB-dependent receptor [Pyrinomonadaceae bacterium]
MSKFVKLALAFAFVLTMSTSVFAQSSTLGAIGGIVSNPSKELVPGAAVTVVNTETNQEATATSDDQGAFRIVNLQPGLYRVTISSAGFTPFSQEGIVVEVGRVTSLEVPLSIGPVSGGTVDVLSEAPVINTTDNAASSNINQTSINELPINGRRASNFVLLTPGVVPDGNFGLLSFRGISGLLNNNTVDGGDNNNAFYAEERGRTRISYVVSQSSIREFQVNTSNYSAEYGRAAGGVVNSVTKSGTNEFHGDLFYYLRDNKFGATNPRTTQTVLVNGVGVAQAFKPVDKRHQFGGSIGGPIVKDKLFFFFTYDEQKRDFPGAAIFPNATYLNLSTADRNTLKARSALITDARIDQSLAFLAGLTGPVPRTQDQRIFFPKIDWVINKDNTFTASYNRMRSQSPAGIETQPTTTKGIATFGDDFVQTDSFNIRLTSTLAPTLLNEFRFQYGRDNLFAFSVAPSAGEAILALGPDGRPAQIGVNGFTFGKQDFLERYANPDEKRWQFADTMTWSTGQHTFRFGGDINRVDDLLDNLRLESGSYNYSNLGDFTVDYLNVVLAGALRAGNTQCFGNTGGIRPTLRAGKCYTSNYQQAFGPTAFSIKTTDYNLFVQDDIRVSPRLTVNLGMRYEYEKLPSPQIPNTLANLAGQLVGPEQTQSLPDDKNNFGPRFGFAYDLTGDGKTSLRGGYGIYYGRIINSTIINAINGTGVAAAQRVFSLAANAADAPIFPNIIPAVPVAGGSVPNIQVFGRKMGNPMIHQADVVFEREIMPNTVVSASFLVSLGRRLPTFTDRNLPAPVERTFTFINGGPLNGQTITVPFFTGARPDTRFGAITEISSEISTEYTALVLQANRRLSKGLQFQVNYTRARTTDSGQNSATFTFTNGPLNPFDTSLEPGRSNLDIPHRFVASAVWTPDAPFGLKDSEVGNAIFGGWTIAPIFMAQSGVPYSANISGFGPSSIAGGITGSGALGRIPFLFERNEFRQPRIWNVDLRLSRRIKFNESMNIEFLAEGFNIFNRYQVTSVNTTLYTFSGSNLSFTPNGPNFGVPSGAGNSIFRERQIQFAARFHF